MSFDDILEPKSSSYEEKPVSHPRPKPSPSAKKPSIESLLGDADVSPVSYTHLTLPTKA